MPDGSIQSSRFMEGAMESVWSQSCQIKEREALRKDLKCEVAVIGGAWPGY